MKEQIMSENRDELSALCISIRDLIHRGEFEECKKLITEAMANYPNAPEPHNLIGLLFETLGDHLTAMKHFRAACSLDPTYLPARQNLESFGTFFSHGSPAYDLSDCPIEKHGEYQVVYDAHHIGHVVKKV